ncbi:MAG: hypothetical protein M3069_29040, partial [Chloroflexota bacterium]|nr:hypothetical protein [Chloroflexota bacterium]
PTLSQRERELCPRLSPWERPARSAGGGVRHSTPGTRLRTTVWYVLLAVFVVVGARSLQERRAYDNEFSRVLAGPFGSNDNYLQLFGLSSGVVERALAEIPISESVIFARRADSGMFQEFSILSYTLWPRRLYAVGCDDRGQPQYTDFAPRTNPFTIAIVESERAPVASEADLVQQVAPTTWLVRASPGRTWASFCP